MKKFILFAVVVLNLSACSKHKESQEESTESVESQWEPNTFDDEGKTPLIRAIENKQLETVRTLIKNGADPNLNRKGATEEFISVEGDMFQTTRRVALSEHEYFPIHFAVLSNNSEIVTELLKHEINVEAKTGRMEQTALHLAAANNQSTDIAKLLIEHDANTEAIDVNEHTILDLAIESKNGAMISHLIQINKTKVTNDLFGRICRAGSLEPIKHIIENKLVTKKMIREAFGETRNIPVSEYLLSKGAKINHRNSRGMAAIHIAAFHGDIDMLKFLHAQGANINIVSKAKKGLAGSTPLMFAATFRHDTELQGLEEKLSKMGIGMSNDGLSNMLGESKEKTAENSYATTKQLIEWGANIGYKNNKNETALHQAIDSENVKAMELLIEHGAKFEKSHTQ